MVYGYIRVSTDRQDCASQKIGIERKANSLGLCIGRYVQDAGISGLRTPNDRALGACLRGLRPGDVIICSELSRLGRRMFMIMRILEHCMNRGAKLYTVKDNYVLDDNLQARVLAFAFGLAAEIERDLISQRTKEALARRRALGCPLGRRPGSRNRSHKLDGQHDTVRQMFHAGHSYREIARRFNVSPATVSRMMVLSRNNPPPTAR